MKKIQKKIQVGILMGSDSDVEIMEDCSKTLEGFGIYSEMVIASAHRSPRRVLLYCQTAEKRGIQVIICGAGHAAHLAGVVASHTTLPVIGVPIDSSSLKGLDALLATVQMPAGIPVATMAIGPSGAKNAGVYAAQIISLGEDSLRKKLKQYKKDLEKKVAEKDRKLRSGQS